MKKLMEGISKFKIFKMARKQKSEVVHGIKVAYHIKLNGVISYTTWISKWIRYFYQYISHIAPRHLLYNIEVEPKGYFIKESKKEHEEE